MIGTLPVAEITPGHVMAILQPICNEKRKTARRVKQDAIDPKLTLDNPDIARHHIRALLQSYHQDRIPGLDPDHRHDLFSVLATVAEFRDPSSILNRQDFAEWLGQREDELRSRISSWIPEDTSLETPDLLLSDLHAIESIKSTTPSAPPRTELACPSDRFDAWDAKRSVRHTLAEAVALPSRRASW